QRAADRPGVAVVVADPEPHPAALRGARGVHEQDPAAAAREPQDRALHPGVDQRVVGLEPREALLDRAPRHPAPRRLPPGRADAAVVADQRAVLHLDERALAGAARDPLVLPGAAAVVAVDVAAQRRDDEAAGL